MYNQEQKEEFIKFYERQKIISKGFVRGLFKKTQIFEDRLNQDVSYFSNKDLIDMFTEQIGRAHV